MNIIGVSLSYKNLCKAIEVQYASGGNSKIALINELCRWFDVEISHSPTRYKIIRKKGVAVERKDEDKRYGEKPNRRKGNEIKILDNYAIGRDKDGNEFYFDVSDIDIINKFTWYVAENGYVISANGVLLHRFIMNPRKDMVVDHINRNKSDNRRSNLRVCTQLQNMQNADHRGKMYYAPVSCLGYVVDDHPELGVFETRQEAIDVYMNIGK